MTTATASPTLRLTPLGGVGRFGKNCLLVEHDGGAVLVDCGVRFAGPELPGFDAGLPDLERLATVPNLQAVIVTHGHEDHIGALPFLLRDRPVPVLATPYTAAFIERRCRRFDVKADVERVPFGAVREVAGLAATFAAVSHSIPGAASLVLHTPIGVVVHSGDFRIDPQPVLGPPTDVATLAAAAGDTGVRCLLADSTGALTADGGDEATGTLAGVERSVLPRLMRCFDDDDGNSYRGLVVVGLFASHLQRLAVLAEVCRHKGRKLVLLGAGLREVFALAQAQPSGDGVYDETGARAFADVVISEAHAHSLPRERLCLAVTGTQGEPQAALARLARGDGDLPFSLQRGDRVVLSARVIPGNELKLQAVLDDLIDRGVDVVGGRRAPHVSGHGGQRDLQALLAATRPQTFVALHGTPQHLVAHGALARQGGLAAGAVVALRDGHTLELSREGHRHIESGKAHEPAVVDGEVCDFPRGIAATRLRLGQGGVVALTVRVDADGAAVVTVTTRGMFPPLSDDVRRALTDIVHERQARGLPLDDDDADRAYRRPWRKGYAPAPVVVVTRC